VTDVMRAVTWQGPSQMAMADVVVPEPGAGELLVRVDAASICGSDLAGYKGTLGNRFPGQIMGHEIAGTVVHSASSEYAHLVGTPVVVNPLETCGVCRVCLSGAPQRCDEGKLIGVHRHGGFAEFVTVRASNVLPSPEGVPQTLSSLVEPLAHAFHDVRMASIDGLPEELLLIGAGSIGIFALIAAQAVGVTDLTVIEPDPGRRALASALGAAAVASAEEVQSRQFDVVMECVGLGVTRSTAVDRTRRGGTVVLVGLAQPQSDLGFMGAVVREIVLRGAFAYTPQDFDDARDYLVHRGLPPEVIIDTASLSDAPEVFARLGAGPQSSLKTVLTPG
jgi:2-desacetyl-2-hydroxyethyl bacteriochlorophyllide A dehydrogenase